MPSHYNILVTSISNYNVAVARTAQGDNMPSPPKPAMCADMCIDICIDMCVDMYIDMCIDICIKMRTDICMDMYIRHKAVTCHRHQSLPCPHASSMHMSTQTSIRCRGPQGDRMLRRLGDDRLSRNKHTGCSEAARNHLRASEKFFATCSPFAQQWPSSISASPYPVSAQGQPRLAASGQTVC